MHDYRNQSILDVNLDLVQIPLPRGLGSKGIMRDIVLSACVGLKGYN
jgi:hypothetical protein